MASSNSHPIDTLEVVLIQRERQHYTMEYYRKKLEDETESGTDIIIIDMPDLIDEVNLWMGGANWMHRFSIFCGCSSVVLNISTDRIIQSTYLSLMSVYFSILHSLVWKVIPCRNYLEEVDPHFLHQFRFQLLESQKPLVLKKKAVERREKRFLQNSIMVVGIAICAWKWYRFSS